MGHPTSFEIRALDRDEVDAILARNHVGRIAYSFHDRVGIEPIRYALADGWIYGSTAPGVELVTVEHNYWVAFEVDEFDSLAAWRSVVVMGGFYRLVREGNGREREAWDQAVALLRPLIPEMPDDPDALSFPTELFRIAVQEVAGKATTVAPRA